MKVKLLTEVMHEGIVRKPGVELDLSRPVALDLIHRKRAFSLEAAAEVKTVSTEALKPEPEKSAPKGK